MKRERKAALGIGGIVIVAAAVGLALFLFTSSKLGVGFIAVGIPLTLIVGVGIYVRSVISSRGTSQSSYAKQQANDTATMLRDFHTEFGALRNQYPTWNPDGVESAVERIADDLESHGVSFDTDAGTFSTERFGSADVQELERIHSDIEDLDATLADSFESFVRSEIEQLRNALDRLEDAGLTQLDSWRTQEWLGQQRVDTDSGDVDDLEEALAVHREEATETVGRASEEVEDLLGDVEADVDNQRVHGLLDDAESRAAADEHTGAVDAVLDAQAALEGDLSGQFEGDRESVENLLEAVQSSVVETYVSNRHIERVEDVETAMASLDSALDVADLREQQGALRDACTAMVAEMESDLDSDLSALGKADVPADYYDWPSAADQNYETQLRGAESIDEFRTTWTVAVGSLSNALDQTSEKASVAQSYDDIESVIEEKLRAKADVTADDLPVKQADAFMELYARNHPAVSYDSSGPVLVAAGESETYDMTAFVRFDEGGPERGVTVEIEGCTHEDSEYRETHLAEEVIFEEIPYGEYTVRANPSPDDYRTPEETVTVEDDVEVELTMEAVGLREQVCEGVEGEIREYLSELTGDLNEQYESEGYLSASMDYPITDEYVPCLLALWAEEKGLSVMQADDGLVAYDGEQLTQEVEMVVRHNLDEGNTIAFDDIRDSFLSAPITDDVIRKTVTESAVAESVEITPTGITKNS